MGNNYNNDVHFDILIVVTFFYSSKTLVATYKKTWYYNPEDLIITQESFFNISGICASYPGK
jgi:hypothetical protein